MSLVKLNKCTGCGVPWPERQVWAMRVRGTDQELCPECHPKRHKLTAPPTAGYRSPVGRPNGGRPQSRRSR